jgi:hypothetical protein
MKLSCDLGCKYLGWAGRDYCKIDCPSVLGMPAGDVFNSLDGAEVDINKGACRHPSGKGIIPRKIALDRKVRKLPFGVKEKYHSPTLEFIGTAMQRDLPTELVPEGLELGVVSTTRKSHPYREGLFLDGIDQGPSPTRLKQ